MNTFYLSIEGGDGSGKTTLVKKLYEYFLSKNKKVLLTKEFGSEHDFFCKELRNFALSDKFNINEEAGQLLFASIIKQHQEKVIKPSFGKYDVILSDRGPYSNYAYGPAHELDNYFIKTLFDLVYTKAKWPNLSIFVNTPVDLAYKRRLIRSQEVFSHGGNDRVEAKGLIFQEKVIKNFIEISKNDTRIKLLNVNENMTTEDVLAKAIEIIKEKNGEIC